MAQPIAAVRGYCSSRVRGAGLPLVVLARAGAVGDGDGPVEVLSVEAGGVGRAALEHHLPAQETRAATLV